MHANEEFMRRASSLKSAAKHAQEAQQLERTARVGRGRPHKGLGAWVKDDTGVLSSADHSAESWGAWARRELKRLEALHPGPRRPQFPAFAGRSVKGFPYNVMGNVGLFVNAV
jgi:hypothetical protein